jgi:pimeloyl-ACP methyl ester carboxylesterase
MTANAEIRPYRIDIPQADLDDIDYRLDRTIWTDEIPGSEYGVSLERVKRLAGHWRNGFDWRALEARLNAYPQFTTQIDGQNIHFLHVRSDKADALPLILTHGWPGSVLEFLDVVEPLTAAGFDLVIPSMPGYGFSGPTKERGWNLTRIAEAWIELMDRLGYERFGAVGNDAGSMISPEIARLVPERVVGMHVTQLFSFPTGDPSEFEGMTGDELEAMQRLQWFWEKKGSFNQVQSQQPQTLAHALADSPVGLLGWNSQLFDESLDDEFVVANVALYWLTRTAGSSMRLYFEMSQPAERPSEPTTVPTALAASANDFLSIRRFAERDHKNITRWNVYDTPGHYAAHQATDVLVTDIVEFYETVR